MASRKQLEANRRNARRSTGPRTPEGKAKVATNALKHGLFSSLEVLPGLERPEEWQEHLEKVLADLCPAGYLEQTLAERVASLLWRLGRVARYERESVAVELQNADKGIGRNQAPGSRAHWLVHPGEDPEDTAALARACIRVVENLLTMGASEAVKDGNLIVRKACDVGGQAATDVWKKASRYLMFLIDPKRIWTARELQEELESMAKSRKMDVQGLLEHVKLGFKNELASVQGELDAQTRMVEQKRRLNLLPSAKKADKVTRCESHLERSFYKALHELQRRQAARLGGPGGG